MSSQSICPKLVVIEGNISAGKTTLTRVFSKSNNCKVFVEPANENPFLSLFYQNPRKWALPLQLWILRLRYVTYLQALEHVATSGNVAVLDRSIFSDWVFAEQNRRDGNISQAGFNYYLSLRNSMMSSLPLPGLMIYLDVTSQECHRRVHDVRQRSCESGIPLEYLSGLSSCYASLVQEMQSRGCSVTAVNWNGFGDPIAVANSALSALSNEPFKLSVQLQAQLHSTELMRRALSDADSRDGDLYDSPEYLPSVEQIKAFIAALAVSAEESAPQVLVSAATVGSHRVSAMPPAAVEVE
jgi:NADH dehydrogenase (ubiquinone) 1 alpha subcomplex subunit 10